MIDLGNPDDLEEYRRTALHVVAAHIFATHDAVMDAGGALIISDEHESAQLWSQLADATRQARHSFEQLARSLGVENPGHLYPLADRIRVDV